MVALVPSAVVRALVQRVSEASVIVGGEVVGAIGAGILAFVDTKNGQRRDIPMNDVVRSTLKRLPRRGEYVFTYKGEGMVSVGPAFKRALKAAGIEDFRFHDLRHTFASHAAMAGIDIRTLQQLLGHKSLQMTMRYAHLAPDHAMRAVQRVKLGGADTEVREVVIPFGR